MSKMDNLRAMREARYEQARARGAHAATTTTPARPSSTASTTKAPAQIEPDGPEASEALCGHRNMGGRTCTREAGHAARSHRYS
jgi:hypothetical protein